MARESWRDSLSDPDHRGGGLFRRIFGQGDNPLTWALPLYRAWGITVAIHIGFVIYIVLVLLMSIPQGAAGVGYKAVFLLSLFGLVLLHEYGHCFACRRIGGEADHILMWPLGGLASCLPPHGWKPELITTLGGPAVNAALVLPLGLLVYALTGQLGTVVFNPFAVFATGGPISLIEAGSAFMFYAKVLVFQAYFSNWVLLAFNVLVPMYPMDGGRILRALLWRSTDEAKASDVSSTVGLIAAMILVIVGLVTGETILAAIGLLGGLVCWTEKQRRRMMGDDPILVASAAAAREQDTDKYEANESDRQREARIREEQEIDRILAKISERGMGSLTRKERRTLERVSRGADSQ